MIGFPWLPLGHAVADGTVGQLQHEGSGYQIVLDQTRAHVLLLLQAESLVADSARAVLGDGAFSRLSAGGGGLIALRLPKSHEPVPLSQVTLRFGLPTADALARIGRSIALLRERHPDADLCSALYLPVQGFCLATTNNADATCEARALAAGLLTGATPLSSLEPERICAVNPALIQSDVVAFLAVLGIGDGKSLAGADLTLPRIGATAPDAFSLPGRPALEAFFREYVIEPSFERQRYAALGVRLPNAILLHGPAGAGKSHAVEMLARVLRRAVFRIDVGSLGSPFIHQTAVSIRQSFDRARQNAPALLILEEIDALAAIRGPQSQDHKIEELTELLRIIEVAASNDVLVIATTNRKEALDPALLRTGRFDHCILVDYPTREEVAPVLRDLLKDRAHAIEDLSEAADLLAGRPMSDAAWLVNEAARLTARAGDDVIGEATFRQALWRLRQTTRPGQ